MNIENNKIIAIAEFLGYVLRGKNTYEYKNKLYLIEELKFHNDWNLLMEVVEKIFSEECIKPLAGNGMYYVLELNIEETLKKAKIQAVYNACVELIVWYNQQEK